MTTTDYTNELKQIIKESSRPGERPFVCDGYPNECHVMIVGTNPATPLNTEWRDSWKPDYGFDYNLFVAKYANARVKKGKNRPSKTRQRLNLIRDCLREVKLECIETNVYAREAEFKDRQNQLWKFKADERYPNDKVLDFLIKGLQPPKALIPHGGVATNWLATQRSKLPDDIRTPDCKIPQLGKREAVKYIDYICEWVKNL